MRNQDSRQPNRRYPKQTKKSAKASDEQDSNNDGFRALHGGQDQYLYLCGHADSRQAGVLHDSGRASLNESCF